jgi:hypothetical protein
MLITAKGVETPMAILVLVVRSDEGEEAVNVKAPVGPGVPIAAWVAEGVVVRVEDEASRRAKML